MSKGKGAAAAAGAARVREGLAGAVLGGAAWTMLAPLGVTLKLGLWVGFYPSLALGFLLGLLGLHRLLWVLAGLGAAGLVAASITPDAARWFLKRYLREDALPKDGVQAVVVLSAYLNSDGYLNGVGADRLLAGLGVVKRTGAPILVTTKFRLPEDPAVTTDGDQARLVTLAATGARWIVTPEVFDTFDEARETAVIARREGFTRVAVVTSPMHTRRACALFERERLAVTCIAAGSRDAAFRALRSPSDRLVSVRHGIYETVAFAYYRMRGRL
jgi:uncharacterized SAM-binding protein YcdF (DUF218 family)